MNKIGESQDNFTPLSVFTALKRRWLYIFLWAISGAVFAFLVALFLISPKYSSTIDLLINQKTDNTQQQYTMQQADLQAINTYKDVIKKSVVLSPVLRDAKRQINYQGNMESLQDSISITNQTNSQVLSISVTDKNPYIAADIANSVGKVFTSKIKKMMQIDNVTIVTKAKPSTNPVFPSKKLFGLIGLIIGLLIGSVLVLINQYFDKSVKDLDFLSELGLTNLGQIYHINKDERSFKIVNVVDDSNSDKNKISRRTRV